MDSPIVRSTPIRIKPNYTDEYKNHTRCKNCDRTANGIEDFTNIKTGSITKTCIKCRRSVYASVKRINRHKEKPLTLKDKVDLLGNMKNYLTYAQIELIKSDNPRLYSLLNAQHNYELRISQSMLNGDEEKKEEEKKDGEDSDGSISD
jgi:hypothetical protein